MDPELKKQLEEIHALARENHRLLENVRRHQIIEFFGKWIIYLVLALAVAYLYVEYLAPILNTYLEAASAVGSGETVLPSAELQKLMDLYEMYTSQYGSPKPQ